MFSHVIARPVITGGQTFFIRALDRISLERLGAYEGSSYIQSSVKLSDS